MARRKFTIYNLQFTILISLGLVFTFYILHFTFYIHPAQAASCQTGDQATGLISSQAVSGTFGNPDQICTIDPASAFVPFKIPGYDDLKSLYYAQAKDVTKKEISGSSIPSIQNHFIYLDKDNLTINSKINGNGTAVVFVDGGLNITTNIDYGDSSSGLVFVVKGNVNIGQNVTLINAVLISGKTICTARVGNFWDYTDSNCPAGQTDPLATTNRLVVNGSLVSLNASYPIRFRRNLVNNNVAAEVVNQQPKYSVLLKDIFSEPLLITREITAYVPLPSPSNSPSPSPSQSPSPSPSSPPPTPTCQGYKDNDGDGYGAGAVQTVNCPGNVLPAGYVSNNSDCYDNNANAKPGQQSFFTSQRGDGSFDYDCSGGLTYTYNAYGDSSGCHGQPLNCGTYATQNPQNCASKSGNSCQGCTANTTQACR